MSVIGEILFWFTVFLTTGGLLFCSVYTLILFADLTVDHINPIELCDYVNRLVVPEYLAHTLLTVLVFLRGFYFAATLNVPLLAFHFRRLSERKHLLQNTSIFNELFRERAVSQGKLGYHLLMFFIYLYFFIVTLINY